MSVNLDHYFQLVENSFDYIANNNVVQEELNQMNLMVRMGTGTIFLLFKGGTNTKTPFTGIYQRLYERYSALWI